MAWPSSYSDFMAQPTPADRLARLRLYMADAQSQVDVEAVRGSTSVAYSSLVTELENLRRLERELEAQVGLQGSGRRASRLELRGRI